MLQILNGKFSPDEEKEIFTILNEIEGLKCYFALQTEDQITRGLSRICYYRQQGSNTLRAGEIAKWQEANRFCESLLTRTKELEWSDILQINSILTQRSSDQVIRKKEIYLGVWQAASLRNLPEFLDEMKNQFFSKKYLSPVLSRGTLAQQSLVRAALLQYWLVSLHPFWDGNGRTSVLVADTLFLREGYLPQSFAGLRNVIVAHLPSREFIITPGIAVARILQNLKHSYEILLSDEGSVSAIK